MPAIQTTYSSDYAPAVAGMIANQETRNVVSLTVQDATLAFGVPVFHGTYDNSVTATPGSAFRGISCIDRTVAPLNPNSYAQQDTAAVLTFGVVWVVASSAVVAGEPVYVTAAGLFTDVANSDTPLPRATFDSSAAAGALAKIRLA